MKHWLLCVVAAATVSSVPLAVAQTKEDAASACTKAASLIMENDLVAALSEANWCVESLQQLRQQAILAVFPSVVESYAGGETSNQNAMGINIIEREYSGVDGSVNVLLTTGVAGGGLAALAQLGLGLGSGGGKKIRVQGRTVMDLGDSSQGQYMVQLESGATLMITSEELNSERLLPFVKAFPIAELDDTLP